jgi:Transposase DDE domain
MVEHLFQSRPIPGRWIACDEGFGDNPRLLDRLAKAGLWYLAEVPKATTVWPSVEPDGQERARPTTSVPERAASGKGRAPTKERVEPDSPAKTRLDGFSEAVVPSAWRRFRLLEGAKGSLVADFVAFRALAVRNELPGPEVWVLIRRKVSGSDEEAAPKYKFYLSNAPADTSLEELVRVCGMRWSIESAFEEAKGELGLDQYELRFWRGWHHHMTLAILAHHFLVRLQIRLNQIEGAPGAGSQAPGSRGGSTPTQFRPSAGAALARPDAAAKSSCPVQFSPDPPTASSHSAATTNRPGSDPGAPALPAAPQGRRLPLPSQTTAPTLG